MLCPRFNTWWRFFFVRSYFAWKWFGDRVSCLLCVFFSCAIQLFGMDKYWKKFSIHISVRTQRFTLMWMRICIECLNWWYERRMNKLPQHMILGMHIHSCLAIHRDIHTVLHEIDISFRFSFSFFLSISLALYVLIRTKPNAAGFCSFTWNGKLLNSITYLFV